MSLTRELTSVFADAAANSTMIAPEQAGIFAGDNPAVYNKANPLRLWTIQLIVIIAMTQLLATIGKWIRQPRVIAEVIGGIILGPTVMGRIPHFQERIFPTDPNIMSMLVLTSNIGLVLFLFLVGLEIDTTLIKRNVRASLTISLAGLLVPLGLGSALGVAIYRQFVEPVNPGVNYGYFLLFTAVAVGITAFPVLCRILTELKLLDTTVGVVTLSAGVGNDVVGWILLALTVALVNASTGLTALWVLLTSVGYTIFLLFPVRWGFKWLARRTGSLEKGAPTPLMMTITLLMVFISAFFTDIIGVHAIFGGFLAGLVIPHENGFHIAFVEKIEDLVTILLLPLYFTLSGLRTNLGLLDNGITWGYTILICVVSFVAKFLPCFIAAKTSKFNLRESGAIGSLMACKGLVELIVLNVGFQAGILDTRTFSMFVVHAIVLTFITTPLTLLFYPERVRVHEGSNVAKDTKKAGGEIEAGGGRRSSSDEEIKTRFAFVLDKLEQLPAAMTLSQLLHTPSLSGAPSALASGASSIDKEEKEKEALPELGPTPSPPARPHQPTPTTSIDALRLVELTDRTSGVFKSQSAETLIQTDPIVNVFRTFGYLNHISVSASLSVVGFDDFPGAIERHVRDVGSEMVLLPWSRGNLSGGEAVRNPFDGVFHKTTTQPAPSYDQTSSVTYSEYIRKVFMTSPTDVGLFVDRGLNVTYTGGAGGNAVQLFLPFFGGPDDRLALNFLVQLCSNGGVKGTVVRMGKTDPDLTPVTTKEEKEVNKVPMTLAAADTVYGQANPELRLHSETADNILWDKYTHGSSSTSHSPRIRAALNQITFTVHNSAKPLHELVDMINAKLSVSNHAEPMIVIAGRSRRLAVESHAAELAQLVSEKGSSIGTIVSKTLGEVGAALVAAETRANLLIVQAAIAEGSA